MPNLREIVQQRAKVPAKIHSMDGAPGKTGAAPAPQGPIGGPLVVQYSAAQMGGDPAPSGLGNAGPSGEKRPPRPPGATSPGGNSAGPLRKASEGRRPRSGSEPGRRAPSAPPRGRDTGSGDGNSDAASDGRRPAPKAKARASSVRAPRISDAAPPVDRKDVGKVPAYLRRRNEEMAEEKRRAARPPSPQAPPGYRKVPGSEKQATLDVLRQRKKEVETAQRNLPFKIETAGQKQREKDLTDRSAHLDKLIGMFSQPVVFIPADAEAIASSVPPLPQGLAGRPTRERDDGPALLEDAPAERASREPRQRSASVGQEVGAVRLSSCEGRAPTPGAANRPSSRESRARAQADRRVQDGAGAPWDRGQAAPAIRTGVQVAAPPGGKSSLSLNWD